MWRRKLPFHYGLVRYTFFALIALVPKLSDKRYVHYGVQIYSIIFLGLISDLFLGWYLTLSFTFSETEVNIELLCVYWFTKQVSTLCNIFFYILQTCDFSYY
jgi:hypothetical protein